MKSLLGFFGLMETVFCRKTFQPFPCLQFVKSVSEPFGSFSERIILDLDSIDVVANKLDLLPWVLATISFCLVLVKPESPNVKPRAIVF